MLGKIEGRRRRGRQRMSCWMASPTQWTWVWASCRSWWWTGRPGVLQSMGLQRIRYHWATELNWLILWVRNSGSACSGGLGLIRVASAQQLELEDVLWRWFHYSHAYYLQDFVVSLHMASHVWGPLCEIWTSHNTAVSDSCPSYVATIWNSTTSIPLCVTGQSSHLAHSPRYK